MSFGKPFFRGLGIFCIAMLYSTVALSQNSVLEQAKALFGQKKYEDVLLAKPGIAVEGATDELAVRTWRKDGCDYMLIVNCTGARQQATWRLPRKIGDMSVDLGPAPKVNGDRLEVDFSPMAYTMLRLK